MTGKELIIYILQYNLENEEMFEDGKFVGFIAEEEMAVKLFGGLAFTVMTLKPEDNSNE